MPRHTRLVAVRLLDTSGGGSGLASSLGGELLTRGLATSGLACCAMLVRMFRDALCCRSRAAIRRDRKRRRGRR